MYFRWEQWEQWGQSRKNKGWSVPIGTLESGNTGTVTGGRCILFPRFLLTFKYWEHVSTNKNGRVPTVPAVPSRNERTGSRASKNLGQRVPISVLAEVKLCSQSTPNLLPISRATLTE